MIRPSLGAQDYGSGDGAHGGAFDLGEMLAGHILDADKYELPFAGYVYLPRWDWLVFGPVDLNPSKHTILLLAAAAITAFLALYAARAATRAGAERAPGGIANAMEAMVAFLRDDLCRKSIGDGYERFAPLILTLFFFVLAMNLMGLVPWGGSASGNLAVTGSLALVVFLVTEVAGFRKLGGAAYLRTVFFAPPGLSGAMKWVMMAIMTPVEVLGKLTKPFALAIRLFANMTAGHLMIFTVIGFIFLFSHLTLGRWLVASGSFAFVSAIMLLELLIAFIQAYIFAMLSAVFIGLMQHEH